MSDEPSYIVPIATAPRLYPTMSAWLQSISHHGTPVAPARATRAAAPAMPELRRVEQRPPLRSGRTAAQAAALRQAARDGTPLCDA
jgi:hypothetical protein